MTANPDWTRDEIILALDLYCRAGRRQLNPTHPEVIKLSRLLNRLPIHSGQARNADFRNPPGVSMKLGNLLAVDPHYKGAGLNRGGKLDLEVWREFSPNVERLMLTAEAIAKAVSRPAAVVGTHAEETENDDEEFPEGRILTRLHKSKERNRQATDKKKQKVQRERGKLVCEACDFDFARVYGKLGEGFAECHHTLPLFRLSPDYPTRLAELAVLCANCHRIIHRSRPMISVQELRAVIRTNRKI